jgi:hypothetical protein
MLVTRTMSGVGYRGESVVVVYGDSGWGFCCGCGPCEWLVASVGSAGDPGEEGSPSSSLSWSSGSVCVGGSC